MMIELDCQVQSKTCLYNLNNKYRVTMLSIEKKILLRSLHAYVHVRKEAADKSFISYITINVVPQNIPLTRKICISAILLIAKYLTVFTNTSTSTNTLIKLYYRHLVVLASMIKRYSTGFVIVIVSIDITIHNLSLELFALSDHKILCNYTKFYIDTVM